MAFNLEDISKRTAKARHLADSIIPRLYRAEITVHDQHYRDDNSVWQQLDENFVTDGAEGFTHKAEKAAHKVRLISDGTRRWYPRRSMSGEYVEFAVPEFFNGTIWQTLPLGNPIANGNTYLWDRPNYSLQLTFTWRKLKLDVILKNSNAARRIRWAVSLIGLTRIGFDVFGQDGERVGTFDKPFGFDSNNIPISIDGTISGGFVEFNADLTGATFPVSIDPTLTSQPDAAAGKDCDMQSGNPTTNSATSTTFKTGVEGAANIYRSLIQFDCSSVPSGATCNSAVMTLYNSFNDVNSTAHTVYELLSGRSGWTEAGATWNTYDGSNNWGTAGADNTSSDRSSTALGTFTSGVAPVAVTCTFTNAAVTTWFGASNSNYGQRISKDDELTPFAKGEYYTSDNADSANRPKLVIDYSVTPSPDGSADRLGRRGLAAEAPFE